VFQARTVVVGLIVGIGVSLVASLNPARKASKIAPVAALGGLGADTAGSLTRRAVIGTIGLAVGITVMMIGLFASHSGQALEVGIGIAVTFLGVATLAPIVARPIASLLGRPLRRTSGMAGVLARENAMRNPRRTASTASALMIGLALVTMFSVFASSAKATINHSIDQQFTADFVMKTTGQRFGNFSPDVEKRVAGVPGIAAQSAMRTDRALYNGSSLTMTAVSATDIGKVLKIDLTSGSLSSLGKGQLMVEDKAAKKKGWTVGTPVHLQFAKTGTQTLVVGGTYKANQLIGSNYMVSLPVFEANFTDQYDQAVLIKMAKGANPQTVRSALETAVNDYPNVTVSDAATVKKDQASQINGLLTIIYVLLTLAVIIAVLGIINTLVLSVVERTRELGLLRAIGMVRRQMRRMIRGESVIIALLGAVMGLVVGSGFGIALTKAVLANTPGAVVSVPVPNLVIFVILAAILGVLAAVWPARRAARTNVLAALAFE
jgi:putative ABC transport system permease protein